MKSFILQGGRIFDGENFFEGDIAVKDGVIAEMGVVQGSYDFTIDVSSCIVSAGLLDVHVHMKGVSTDVYGVSIDPVCLPFGVTCAADGGAEKGDKAFLETLDIYAAVFLFAPFQNGVPDYKKLDELLQAYGDRAVGVKMYYDSNQPEKPTLQLLKSVCDYAHGKGLKVMVHCAGSPDTMVDIVATLGKGDILTHIYHGGKNTIVEEDFKAYKLAKEKGVVLDAGMAGGVHTNWSVLQQAAGKGYFPDTISTDVTNGSAFLRGGNYGLTTCMSIFRAIGMEETELFRSVTSNAAEAINAPKGRLQIGEKADISVLKWEKYEVDEVDSTKEHFKIGAAYVCQMTVIGGQILYRR